jgi:hypothetical protein
MSQVNIPIKLFINTYVGMSRFSYSAVETSF